VVTGPRAAQLDVVLNGKKAMPPFKGVLSATEIAAVTTYTRNSWSNKAKENIVQPAEVVALRK
jgi:cytochrome c oxidase subunit 2